MLVQNIVMHIFLFISVYTIQGGVWYTSCGSTVLFPPFVTQSNNLVTVLLLMHQKCEVNCLIMLVLLALLSDEVCAFFLYCFLQKETEVLPLSQSIAIIASSLF